MTTKNSPLSILQAQAEKIASTLKSSDFKRKMKNLGKNEAKFAVVMDDKIIKITMPMSQIEASTQEEIKEFILKEMREKQSDA